LLHQFGRKAGSGVASGNHGDDLHKILYKM
jgi:hypothetical protein